MGFVLNPFIAKIKLKAHEGIRKKVEFQKILRMDFDVF